MEMMARQIVRHRKGIVVVFLAAAVICAFLLLGVSVNYSLTDYLPPDALSTTSLRVMQEEFVEAVPNARVMIEDVSITEALAYKETLAGLPGVTEVLWLDDVTDVKVPLEMAEPAVLETYYIDGNALFSLAIAEAMEVDALQGFYDTVGERGAIAGEAVATASAQMLASSESLGAAAILVPIVILILILTTRSWLEPGLFLAAIGVSVVMNMGTNFFLGAVSNITMSISPILQLAVSLDYAIFLLHRFEQYREKAESAEAAMVQAIAMSAPAVGASAATTLFGFLALMFMRFQIGPDLGLNLAKGIVFSYLSVMVFLPALTLCSIKLMDRLRHRPFVPELNKLGKRFLNIRFVALALVLILVVPAFLAQQNLQFIYGMGEEAPDSRPGIDAARIAEHFESSINVVVLVPKGDVAREYALGQALGEIETVSSVLSYAGVVGPEIPADFLDATVTANFYSENLARLILYVDTAAEGDVAFDTVEQIRAVAGEYYTEVYCLGQSVNLYDIKDVVTGDTLKVNLIAIIAIALVILLTFRSLALPVLLVLVIEAAIWINLAIPYFSGTAISFIGFLVINTVQLGATIDYAILLTESFMGRRRVMGKREAMVKTLNKNFMSILTSATTLATAGFVLSVTSSNYLVTEMGLLLCRGTILSFILVMCVLPCLLLSFDAVIGKLTLQSNFYREGARK